MNEITEKQFEKIKNNFEISELEDGWVEITGVKTAQSDFQVGKMYRFILRQYLVNEPKNFSLSTNWNNGVKFKSVNFSGIINQLMGKMINCTGSDDLGNNYDSMWIPKGAIDTWEEVM